jgi:hypothetical protein
VAEGDDGWEFTLGGLESVVEFGRGEPISLSPNPYYAPPEAIGLYKHAPGPVLRAWDWWSLGRTLQTLVLGQPILGKILRKDVTKLARELQPQAAELTLERLPGAMRAGAVEQMGRLEPRLESLLQGLLTFQPDGRWGWPQIEAWADGGEPHLYYKLPRSARLFRWNDRGYAIADAASAMRTREHWAEAERQIFGQEDPGSLYRFIAGPHGDPALAQQLDGLHQLALSSTFEEFPPSLVREVVTALALMELSGGKFVWRGEPLTTESLRHQLTTREEAEGFLGVVLLSHPKIRQRVNGRDTAAERLLRELAETAETVEVVVVENAWWELHDQAARARLWRLSLDAEEGQAEACARLRARFAHSTRPEVEALFRQPTLNPAERILLAATAEEPERFGYVTHADCERERHARLRAEGRGLHQALFWRQLGSAVEAGFWLFARWPVWLGLLTAFAALGLVARPGPAWVALAFAPAALTALFRFIMQQSIAELVHQVLPEAARWRWSDGAARCRAEAREANPERSLPRLRRRLERVNEELAELTRVKPPPQPIAAPPGPTTVWIAVAATWVALGSLGGFYGMSLLREPFNWPEIRQAWMATSPEEPGDGAEVLEIDLSAASPEADPTTEVDLAGMREKLHEALAIDQAFALRRGRELAAAPPLPPGEHPLAVLLPGETIRLMVFDPAADALLSPNIFLRAVEPERGEILGLGGVEAIYLGP